MKNVVFSIIIFIVMIFCMFFSINYLSKTTTNLQTLNNELEEYIKNDNWEKAYNASLDITKKWQDESRVIKIFVNHQEIDNIELELWKIPQYVKEKTKDEALASVHVLKFLLLHIYDLEKVNIQNIF
ncbi:protein of unknown function [Clostridium sp. USBA 49]|uniref:DUF4363 family protein n=1 Tax=Clostridium TaxID=1485 RepID=UPI0009999106|nr:MULTISPECIES: DUF4363 family protein [Clostridium]SKA84242.1 protein of unknown function [Clostridium sp. USBA 49]